MRLKSRRDGRGRCLETPLCVQLWAAQVYSQLQQQAWHAEGAPESEAEASYKPAPVSCFAHSPHSLPTHPTPTACLPPQVSKYLRECSLTHTSKTQMFIKAFAKALEVIPRQLCSNAGFDAIDVLNMLRQKHAAADASGKVRAPAPQL